MIYDAVIIGAGPAGLAAAKILASNNRKVIVLEKNHYAGNKVCAEGITRKTRPLIPDKAIEREFCSVIFHSPLQTAELRQKKPFMWMIDRKKLFNWQLGEAEKAGAKVSFNSDVKAIKDNHVICNGRKIRFNHIIGADGSNSSVRKSLGIKTENIGLGMQYTTEKIFDNIEVFLNHRKYGNWYLWIFPRDKYTSIGVGASLGSKNVNAVKRHLQDFVRAKGIDPEKCIFQAALLNADYRGFKFGNKFLAGDAAGLVSELTGEGIYQAIVSGEDIAKGILDPGYDFPKIKEILRMNKRHSRILKILSANSLLTSPLHEVFLMCLRNKHFRKKIADKI